MPVVSDTSPLCNLAVIGRLELLRFRYGRILIPVAVQAELTALKNPAGKAALADAFAQGWIEVDPLAPHLDFSSYLSRADPGECEAIALAEWRNAAKILLDDRAGRELARERGLKVTGVLGELLHAKVVGRIGSVREEMDRLQSLARFFIDPELRKRILMEASE
jgi:predicted nucleic acid-binding protein